MPDDLAGAVYVITSADPNNPKFGTGFVIHKHEGATYLLTCLHVVERVGMEKVRAAKRAATLVAPAPPWQATDDLLDLAILRVDAELDGPCLPLSDGGQAGAAAHILGYRASQIKKREVSVTMYLKRGIKAALNQLVWGEIRDGEQPIRMWALQVTGDNQLEPGYSGGPIVDTQSSAVLAITQFRDPASNEPYGIESAALRHVWREAPPGMLRNGDAGPRPAPASPDIRLRISISRMPVTGQYLFGRDEELRLLDALWSEHRVNVVTLIAFGGVGKSALMNAWLRRLGARKFEGTERVYAWSFYTHGTAEPAGSGDLFVESALAWFGDEKPREGTAWEKGERLARLVKAQPTLLVLDGLEPLQYPPGSTGPEGRIKDQNQAVQALLRELAASNPGLCLVSSRLRLTDLADFETTTVRQIDLEHVKPEDGARLLRALGVRGDEAELRQAAASVEGHCLTLTLLGSYLVEAFAGDVRRCHELGPLEPDAGLRGHAWRVMKSYESWFDDRPESRVLRLLGLFDRPAPPEALAALTAPPVIPDLTDGLVGLPPEALSAVLATLRRTRLLAEPDRRDPDSLDAHPLVRAYFGEQLRQRFPAAWRAGNNRLYEHFKARAEEEFPKSLEGMEPLFQAVVCGCNAGRERDALHDVYLARIMRGDEFYAAYQLGAVGPLLSVLVHFFTGGDWGKPVEPAPPARQGLDRAEQWRVLIQAGIHLSAAKSFAAKEAGVAFARAAQLSSGDAELFTALRGLWVNRLVLAALQEARSLARRLHVLAQGLGESRFRLEAETAMGVTCHYTGQARKAGNHLREATSIYKFNRHHACTRTSGMDPGVIAWSYLTVTRWRLGYPDQACQVWQKCIALAERAGHPFSKCLALYMGMALAGYLRDAETMLLRAQELLDYVHRQGSHFFLAMALFEQGAAKFEAALQAAGLPGAGGLPADALAAPIAEMEEALREHTRTGSVLPRSNYLVTLAEALGTVQRADDGLGLLLDARQLIEQHEDRQWEAEWFRVKGELLQGRPGGKEQAAACYRDALTTARRQGAKSLELRAATGYARLLARQGEKAQARKTLAGIYRWFKEGHARRDLLEAKAFLDSL
jgi:hypothetical protein